MTKEQAIELDEIINTLPTEHHNLSVDELKRLSDYFNNKDQRLKGTLRKDVRINEEQIHKENTSLTVVMVYPSAKDFLIHDGGYTKKYKRQKRADFISDNRIMLWLLSAIGIAIITDIVSRISKSLDKEQPIIQKETPILKPTEPSQIQLATDSLKIPKPLSADSGKKTNTIVVNDTSKADSAIK